VSPCLLPDDFETRDPESQALLIHACHERQKAEASACAARQAELAAWVRSRVKAPAK